MNGLHYFITQSIDWYYYGLDESVFFEVYFLERKLNFISFLVHYSVIQFVYFWWNYFLNNLGLLVGFLRLVCLLIGTYSSWSVIIYQQNVGSYTFSDEICFSATVFYCSTLSSNKFFILNFFSFLFLQTLLLINSISLCVDSWIFCHLLAVCVTCSRVSGSRFWKFIYAFLDAVNAGCRA